MGTKTRKRVTILALLSILAGIAIVWITVTIAGPTADFNERVRQATARFAHELSDSITASGGGAPPDTIVTPPPPPPPPGGQLAGGEACSGFWSGWRADDADRFLTGDGYGIMRSNVNAAVKMDLDLKGSVDFDVWHQSDGCGGGQHLFYVASQTDPRIGPYDPAYPNSDGQHRVDFSVRTGKIYGVLYYDNDPNQGTARIGTQALGTWPLAAYESWKHVKLEWDQTPSRTFIRVNGGEVSYATPPGMNPLGNLFVCGNLDRNTATDRCSACGHNPCGLVGEARFKGFSWR